VRSPKKTPNPRSLKNLREPWEKGQSGNPSGRPKRPITEAMLAMLHQVSKGHNKTFAQLIAEGQIRQAVKGSTMAAKEIADRTEGKARQAVDVTVETPLEFNIEVHFVDSDSNVDAKSLDELQRPSEVG